MMFEAQMTAIFQYSEFPEEKEERAKCGGKEEEGRSPVFECGDNVTKIVYNIVFVATQNVQSVL